MFIESMPAYVDEIIAMTHVPKYHNIVCKNDTTIIVYDSSNNEIAYIDVNDDGSCGVNHHRDYTCNYDDYGNVFINYREVI